MSRTCTLPFPFSNLVIIVFVIGISLINISANKIKYVNKLSSARLRTLEGNRPTPKLAAFGFWPCRLLIRPVNFLFPTHPSDTFNFSLYYILRYLRSAQIYPRKYTFFAHPKPETGGIKRIRFRNPYLTQTDAVYTFIWIVCMNII